MRVSAPPGVVKRPASGSGGEAGLAPAPAVGAVSGTASAPVWCLVRPWRRSPAGVDYRREVASLEGKTVLALITAALSGAAMSFQGTFNAALSRRVGLLTTSAVVHVVGAVLTGLVVAAVWLLARSRLAEPASFTGVPWYTYLGGVLSVFIIVGVAFAFPVTGAGLGVSVIVTAQLAAALILDHFGLFELRPIPVTWVRVLGVVLLIVGTRLVAR